MTEIELLTLINDNLVITNGLINDLLVMLNAIKFIIIFYVMWFIAWKVISVYKIRGIR